MYTFTELYEIIFVNFALLMAPEGILFIEPRVLSSFQRPFVWVTLKLTDLYGYFRGTQTG